MSQYITFHHGLKRGILRFSEKISKNFSKPLQKIITQIFFGILSSQKSRLSCITGNSYEKITLKKVIERLSGENEQRHPPIRNSKLMITFAVGYIGLVKKKSVIVFLTQSIKINIVMALNKYKAEFSCYAVQNGCADVFFSFYCC